MTMEQPEATNETNEPTEPIKPTMNRDGFGDIPPSANIKEILGETINIIGMYSYQIKHDPNSKYDKPDDKGMVTKYVVKTKQQLQATHKGEKKDISNWYVSISHYEQLKRLSTDHNISSLKKMFENGEESRDLIPCKKLGGQAKSYYTWLSPDAYKRELDEGKLDIEN